MPKEISTIQEVLVEQLKDLYSAEKQIAKALPKMARAASAPDLKKSFELHLQETKVHAERIEAVCKQLDEKPTGKKCKAAAGLVEEGQEAIDEEATPEMKDLMLIAAAQRVEHYEIAGYTAAIALAEALGLKAVVKNLTATLDEENATDEKLAKATVPAIGKGVASEE